MRVAVFVSDLMLKKPVATGFPGWMLELGISLLGHLHLLSPVFIMGCCLAAMMGLLRNSEMPPIRAFREMALAGWIATVIWLAAMVALGQYGGRGYMLHAYFWYPLYGAATLLGAILADYHRR